VLWNKSVPWILVPFALVYLVNAGTSLICYTSGLTLTCVALSIVVVYGNGWAHKDTFPTSAITLVYEWTWLGSECIGCRYGQGTASHKAYHSEHHPHHAHRNTAALDESPSQAAHRFGVFETIRVHRRYGVSGGGIFSEAQVTHFCHYRLESGLPLTLVQILYCAVETVDTASDSTLYPLRMQFVVSCCRFTDGTLLRRFLLGNQPRADPLACRQKPLIL
jgi:hypothetical protein